MQPRRELTWSDVPALGFAMAGFVGAVTSLLIALPASALIVTAAIATLCALIALAVVRNRVVAVGLAYCALTCIVCLRGTTDVARGERTVYVAHDPDTAIVHCRGVVIWKDEAGRSGKTQRLLLESLKLDLPDTVLYLRHARLRLTVPTQIGARTEIGDVIACEARIQSAVLFQRRSIRELCWTIRDRLIGTARLIERESFVIAEGDFNVRRALYQFRNSLFDVFEDYLRPDARAVAGALLLGSRTAFSSDFRQELQTTGLAHLFALSGLNTGLLVSLFWLVFGWLRIPRKPRYVTLLLLLAVYTALGLGVPSLFRSSVMAGLLILSRLLARPSHPVNLLLFAAGIELLIWPLHILDAGFHLSYLSMAGILAAYLALHKPFQDLIQIRSQSLAARTVDTLSSTLGAQLATSPAVALMFARVPGLAILANLVAIPIFSLLLVLILVLLTFAQVSTFLASAIARAIEALVSVFVMLTGGAAGITGASFGTQQWWTWTALAICVQLGAIVLAFIGRGKTALTLCLIAMNLLIWPSRFASVDHTRIVSLGSSESECYFLHCGQMNLLIGCGPEWEAERRADQVMDELQSVGASHLDALVIQDRRAQHIGASPRIIEQARPNLVLDFSVTRDTQTSELFDAACVLYGADLQKPLPGQTFRKDGSEIVITANTSNARTAFYLKVADDSVSVAMSFVSSTIQVTSGAEWQVFYGEPEKPLHFPESTRAWSKLEREWVSEPCRSVVMMNVFSLPMNPKA